MVLPLTAGLQAAGSLAGAASGGPSSAAATLTGPTINIGKKSDTESLALYAVIIVVVLVAAVIAVKGGK